MLNTHLFATAEDMTKF